MLLAINNLSKQYKRGDEKFFAVNGVNLEVDNGEFICVIGQSGSGKSTLFNMIVGLIKPTSGDILMEGNNIVKKKQTELAHLRNQKIGYVLQGQNLLTNFNILDNICMPYYLSKRKEDIKKQALQLLDEMGLMEAKDAYPAQLSGGELRRVAIARALLLSPDLIIADEPTSNLDLENSERVMQLLQSINKKGTTVVVSTHDLEVLKYSSKVYKMARGKLVTF